LYRIGVDVLRTLAAIRPIVFVLDDLQWASATPLGFIDAFVCEGGIPGLLFVGTYRVDEVDAAHPLSAMRSRWERLNAAPRSLLLQNLEQNDLCTLLTEMMRLRPADALRLAEAIATRTDGNPYDSTELLNALRRDGALTHGRNGWTWDDASIRQYIGAGDVVDLLTARIDALPPESRTLLEIMACLGDDVESSLVQAAAGCSASVLHAWMTPALDDGLIVLERGHDATIRFRHDRVQQAANSRLDQHDRAALHLSLATRLQALAHYESAAAEQYLPVLERIDDPAQQRRCIALFRGAASQSRLLSNDVAVERFLAAARTMSRALATPDDDGLALALDSEMHAALYRLGRHTEADLIYHSIAERCPDPLQLVDSAGTQIRSLTNRGEFGAALTLGTDLLAAIGFALPPAEQLDASIEHGLKSVARWCDDEALRAAQGNRTEAVDARSIAAASLISPMMPPAIFSDPAILAWLVLKSLDLWAEHGPQPLLVSPICHVGIFSAALENIHSIGYRIVRHVLTESENRGYEQTSIARFLFSMGSVAWFEPFREGVLQARIAREGLLERGDLQNACWTYNVSIPLLLQCSATIEEYAAEIQAGIALCARSGNIQSETLKLPHRQLVRSLLGETDGAGSFNGGSFDEETHLASLAGNPTAAVYYLVVRAQSACIFGNMPELLRYTTAAMALLPTMIGQPLTAPAHVLRAIALASQIAPTRSAERSALLAELDRCRDWMRARAADAPENFLHWERLIEAERARAVGDFAGATAAFETARRSALPCSPLHRALIAERAGLCYLEHGIDEYGALLIADARQAYASWGAAAKVRQLEADYPFLHAAQRAPADGVATTVGLTSETVDMVAILKASQALSSQTSLGRLKEQVVELLAGLTGATAVMLIVADKDTREWLYSPAGGDEAQPIPIKEAGARGLVPLSAFHYVERTREALLTADATRDDRFTRDRYFTECIQCSLLAVPIMSQGELRAVLVLEIRHGRDAFSEAGLGAVSSIAGQLAVSLDNVMLYASLERKVAERTEALAAANAQLAQLSLTDALTGIANRRGFDEQFRRSWRRALHSRTSLGVAMIDVDEFKKYNDGYGHAAGDDCLVRVASALRAGLREGFDVAARYGGEEFVLILGESDGPTTLTVAERVRSAVADLREPHAASEHGIVTISVGVVAGVPDTDTVPAEFLKAADDALYTAKRAGRNRVILRELPMRSVRP
jgi:diguanylate cyclase (GGDEF)-like protein